MSPSIEISLCNCVRGSWFPPHRDLKMTVIVAPRVLKRATITRIPTTPLFVGLTYRHCHSQFSIIVNVEMLMLLPDSPPTQPDWSDREEARLNARYPLLLSGQSDPGNYSLIRVGHRRKWNEDFGKSVGPSGSLGMLLLLNPSVILSIHTLHAVGRFPWSHTKVPMITTKLETPTATLIAP